MIGAVASEGDWPVPKFSQISLVIADELRLAELSINTAIRDKARFLIATLDALVTHRLWVAMTLGTVKATVNGLAALVNGQGQMAMRANLTVEKRARACQSPTIMHSGLGR